MDRRLLLLITSCGLAVASVLLWVQAALSLDNVWVVLCLLSLQQRCTVRQLQPSAPRSLPRAAARSCWLVL